MNPGPRLVVPIFDNSCGLMKTEGVVENLRLTAGVVECSGQCVYSI